MQKSITSPGLDIHKPIKLKIDCQLIGDRLQAIPKDNPKSTLRQMENYISRNTPLPVQLTVRALSLLKAQQDTSEQPERSIHSRTANKSHIDKQNNNSKMQQQSMSQSMMVDNSSLPSQSLLLQSKDTLIGRIKLRKIVNNKKMDIGECQEATPVHSGYIIKNMRDKVNKLMQEKQKAEEKIAELQRLISELEEQKADQIINPDKIIKIECTFNLNIEEPCHKQHKEKSAQDEQFKTELIQNLKRVVACQNTQIENLQNKLVTKKQSHKNRWNNS